MLADCTSSCPSAQVPTSAPTNVTQVDAVMTVREHRTETTPKDAAGTPDRDEVQEHWDEAQLWSPKAKLVLVHLLSCN